MDVSISAIDKEERSLTIKERALRMKAQTKKIEEKNEKRQQRQNKKQSKLLRRRINKEVRSHLKAERHSYLAGEDMGKTYAINTRVKGWRFKQTYIELLVKEAVESHQGATHTATTFSRKYNEWCDSVSIIYTLIDS